MARGWIVVVSMVLVIVVVSGVSAMIREGALGDGCVWIADWTVPVCCAVLLVLALAFRDRLAPSERRSARLSARYNEVLGRPSLERSPWTP